MKVNGQAPLMLALLAGLWWLLSGGDPASWVVGLPAVVAATWSAWRLGTGAGTSLSTIGLLRFLPLFAWESVRGGIDVARRTLAPRMRVRPGLVVYRIRLRRQDARVFFANCVCLLPGTLAADLRGDHLDVHLLEAGTDPAGELHRLERAVARVYPDGH